MSSGHGSAGPRGFALELIRTGALRLLCFEIPGRYGTSGPSPRPRLARSMAAGDISSPL